MTTRQTSRSSKSTRKVSPSAKAAGIRTISGKHLTGKAKVLSSKLSFEARNFKVYTDTVVEPSGYEATRNVIRHYGSVVVLALDDTNAKNPTVLMVRQYRHATGQFLLELPAGHIDQGEKALAAAKRELLEETGFRARSWQKLVTYYASPGFLGETMTIFVARGLTAGDSTPEEDEHIELQQVPLSLLLEMIHAGKIIDGKSIVGALMLTSSANRKRS